MCISTAHLRVPEGHQERCGHYPHGLVPYLLGETPLSPTHMVGRTAEMELVAVVLALLSPQVQAASQATPGNGLPGRLAPALPSLVSVHSMLQGQHVGWATRPRCPEERWPFRCSVGQVPGGGRNGHWSIQTQSPLISHGCVLEQPPWVLMREGPGTWSLYPKPCARPVQDGQRGPRGSRLSIHPVLRHLSHTCSGSRVLLMALVCRPWFKLLGVPPIGGLCHLTESPLAFRCPKVTHLCQ